MQRTLLLAMLTAAAPWALAGEVTGVCEAGAELSRPDSPPMAEAHGAVWLRDATDSQKIAVVVEGVDASRSLIICMTNAEGQYKVVGEMPAGSANRKWVRTTLQGGELPFGVEKVALLSGRGVKIFDDDERLVLRGEVPAFKETEPPSPPPEEKPPVSEPITARAWFQRTDYAGEREPRGVIVAIRREESSALKMEFDRLEASSEYVLLMGTADDMEVVGDFRTTETGGAYFVRDTAKGQDLPLGAKNVGDLAEKRVEVRDGDDRTILYGSVPYADKPQDVESVKERAEYRDTETGAEVTVEVHLDPTRGHERLRMDMRGLPAGGAAAKPGRPTAEVFIENDGGVLTPVGTVPVSGAGRARWRCATRAGDGLPLGAASLREFSGRGFEVRIGATVVASGTLPNF